MSRFELVVGIPLAAEKDEKRVPKMRWKNIKDIVERVTKKRSR